MTEPIDALLAFLRRAETGVRTAAGTPGEFARWAEAVEVVVAERDYCRAQWWNLLVASLDRRVLSRRDAGRRAKDVITAKLAVLRGAFTRPGGAPDVAVIDEEVS